MIILSLILPRSVLPAIIILNSSFIYISSEQSLFRPVLGRANNHLKDGHIDRYTIDITAIDKSAKEYLFLLRRTGGFAHA